MSAVDEFGYHEALHTANLFVEAVDTHLASHPAVAEAGLFDDVEAIVGALGKVYQRLCAASDLKFHKETLT